MAEAIGIELGNKLVVEILCSRAGKMIMSVKDLNSQIERLQDFKSMIEAALRYVDPLEPCSSAEGKMIRNLHGIEARLEYFFDERQTRAKQKELMSGNRLINEVRLFFSSSNQLVSPFRTAAIIKEIRGQLESIANDDALVNLMRSICTRVDTSPRKHTQVLETGPFLDTDVVIGRDGDMDSMVTRLCHSSNDQEFPSADAIVGIGGQGKTTLAQNLYNDERVKGCFEIRLWVSCTPDISVKEVFLRILASATDENKSSKRQLVQLQNWITRAISGKKFILFIDNVWEGLDWEQVKALLKVGAKGSKVLITTRSETVARNMGTLDPYMLRDLSIGESWRLFKHFAFKQGQESGVEAIGEEIAKMIPRVPLVIKVIGRHLADKGTIWEWEAFKNELASNSSSHVRDKIMQTLKISYDQLDKKLKLCVAYCSLFPKGTQFDVVKMVRIWSALGYVESESGNLEDAGKEYVNKLRRCGFFDNNYGDFNWFDMHDVMHDLVLSIDKSSYQMIDHRTSEIAEGVSHVSFWRATYSNWDVPSSVLNIKKQLQSILMVDAEDFKMNQYGVLFPCGCDKLLSRFKCLKVLDLHNLRIEKVPKSLTTLFHLRYLDLSRNPMRKLPNSITRLVNLLSLDLCWCKNLQELPRDMRKLVNLRHLMLYGCFSLSYMPKGLRELKKLRTLDWFVVEEETSESSRSKGSAAGELTELNDLNNLKGWLNIIVDRDSKYIAAETKTIHLGRKEQLTKLYFRRGGKENYMVLRASPASWV